MDSEIILNLILYAKENLELKERDFEYKANRILEISESGLTGAEEEDAIYGELSLLPSEIDEKFHTVFNTEGGKRATDWLYKYCVGNRYVKKAVLDKNPRFESDGLIITINKAKPEFRDPKKAVAGNSVDGGFAKCVICRENEGFGARNKRNLRTVSLSLGSQPWFWQYSPYGYFNEHGIAVNCEHTPMHVDKSTFIKLMDFVDLFPHYFIGCNAPLPSIGGSVLAHDHFQGGGEILPMHKAGAVYKLRHRGFENAIAEVVDWRGTVVRVISHNRGDIAELSEIIRNAWVKYNNAGLGIIAEDEKGIHNAISPTVVKTERGYEMSIILRSNITSEKYPDGVFHAHPEYHVIKKESIGLIEAQGLFILPGRLEAELAEIEKLIEQKKQLPPEYAPFKLIFDEVRQMCGRGENVNTAMRGELGSICNRILENTAVFKDKKQTLKFLLDLSFEI